MNKDIKNPYYGLSKKALDSNIIYGTNTANYKLVSDNIDVTQLPKVDEFIKRYNSTIRQCGRNKRNEITNSKRPSLQLEI